MQQRMFEKKLFYGDNLRILRMHEHFPSESVDLVYLDPPFKPNEQYNVLFRDRGAAGSSVPSASQVRAFEDTWQWGPAARTAFNDVKENAPHEVRTMVESLHKVLGFSNMFAYLAMMAPRLVELHRVMKPTASIWLHCDQAASHYLKILMDAVFGGERFASDVIWKRTTAHSDGAQGRKGLGRIHDSILVYTKSDDWTWNPLFTQHNPDYIAKKYPYVEDKTGRRYGLWDMTGPGGAAKGNPRYQVMGVTKYWRYKRERMERMIQDGLVVQPSPGAVPRQKRYLDESAGLPLQDLWTDISPINSQAAERLGWPTQKPLKLLERIIGLSSNEGDVVLDPFCGCGTTIAAAEGMGRYWSGIDITYDSIPIIRERLKKNGLEDTRDFEVWGSPETPEDAAKLAGEAPYQFQWWAVRRLNGKEIERKKGADKGIDGRITLIGDVEGRFPEAVVSVKAGRTGPAHVRELAGTMQAQKVEVGVLVVLRPPTKAMREAADAEGGYPGVGGEWCPRIQILTAEEIISNVGVKAPSSLPVRASAKQKSGGAKPRTRRAAAGALG
jgi:DNA modification methylase